MSDKTPTFGPGAAELSTPDGEELSEQISDMVADSFNAAGFGYRMDKAWAPDPAGFENSPAGNAAYLAACYTATLERLQRRAEQARVTAADVGQTPSGLFEVTSTEARFGDAVASLVSAADATSDLTVRLGEVKERFQARLSDDPIEAAEVARALIAADGYPRTDAVATIETALPIDSDAVGVDDD